MKLLVSACLLGLCCRYDGKEKAAEGVLALAKKHTLIPFCPEIYGGLSTPRPSAERQGERVVNAENRDVTEQYRKGAAEGLKLFRALGCNAAILKEKSPSCGKGWIYDGSFSQKLTIGNGVTAELFLQEGITVWGETENLPD